MKTPPYTKAFDASKYLAAASAISKGSGNQEEPEEYTYDISKGDVLVDIIPEPSPILDDYSEESFERSKTETFEIKYAKAIDPETREPIPDVPEAIVTAICTITHEVDDWGQVYLDGNEIEALRLSSDVSPAGSTGGHSKWKDTSHIELVSRDNNYELRFEYQHTDTAALYCNPTYWNYKIWAVAEEVGGEEIPCDERNGDGNGGVTSSTLRSTFSTTSPSIPSFENSRAATSITASCTEEKLDWRFNFGLLHGLGTKISGFMHLYSNTLDEKLGTPAALRFVHPLNSYLSLPEEGFVMGARLELVTGSRIIALRYYNDGSIAPIGVDTAGGGFASVLENYQDSGESAFQWQDDSGTRHIYSTTSGELINYIGIENNDAIDVDQYLVIQQEEETSALRQVWSYWDGLVDILEIDSSSYQICLYTNSQLTGRNSEGIFEIASDAIPFKKFTIAYTGDKLHITESTPASTSHPDLEHSWSRSEEGAWSYTRGKDEEAITTTRTRSELEAGYNGLLDVWQLLTETSKNGVVSSRKLDIYQNTAFGNLLLSSTLGYDSPEARTTQHLYDAAGQRIQTTEASGRVTQYSYDQWGRIAHKCEPWGSGDYIKRTSYAYENTTSDNYNAELNEKREFIISPSQDIRITFLREFYDYSTSDYIKRVKIRRKEANHSYAQISITDTWEGNAPNIYARGRVYMTQEVNGVQTWHDYEASSLYGALYLHTSETRVSNKAVSGKSVRKLAYISAAGNTMREEEYLYTRDNNWVLTQGLTHSYDTQNRRTETLYDNGRSSSCAYICNGQKLWEKDTNGILTTHAYDSARQLIESTRRETPTTPESITEWVKDASGRATLTRTHIGAQISSEYHSYDLLGRNISHTDKLGRVTTISYSEDGLTTRTTTATGAVLVNTNNLDGSIAEQSGSGQRHLIHYYDSTDDDTLRHSIYAVDEDGTQHLLEQSTTNCFGNQRTHSVATENGMLTTTNNYNTDNQLTKSVQGERAATTYDYNNMGQLKEQITIIDAEDADNPLANRITLFTYNYEQEGDEVYYVQSSTRYNAEGEQLTTSSKELRSQLSTTLESKRISIDERGNSSTQESYYMEDELSGRSQVTHIPTSDTAATATVIDGFTTEQVDHLGGNYTYTRQYTSSGGIHTVTDPRGNTSIVITDIAGRSIRETDESSATTCTIYSDCCDHVASITDALGNTIEYSYDERGRKIAEAGSATYPIRYSYDDANRLTSFTTYRESEEGDTTSIAYHPATGLEIGRTYPDGQSESRQYNDYNQLASMTNARGQHTTHYYNTITGELIRSSYSDESSNKDYSYNHLGQITSISDAVGSYEYSYNSYSEQIMDSQALETGKTSYREEQLDDYGRSSGYTYTRKNKTLANTIEYSYDSKGRISNASFSYSGKSKTFGYTYLAGTRMITSISHPNGIESSRSYEEKRDLLTSIIDTKGSSILSSKSYDYDTIGRPTARSLNEREDLFGYNTKSELTSAQLGTDSYAYNYDEIGNRLTAQELEEEINYISNENNQYTDIKDFTPTYDADGNQSTVKTATGIWSVEYNIENRPVKFTSEDGSTIIENTYDYMGRRGRKKVTVNGTVTEHLAYLYRGYLQIATEDLLSGNYVHQITWDPTEATATRPLAIKTSDGWHSYGLDLSKNVTELYNQNGVLSTTYTYTPFGAVTATGDITVNPLHWSSEIYDEELALTYYNYRHYNPTDGRWINRDPIGTEGGFNLYSFIDSYVIGAYDELGLTCIKVSDPAIGRKLDKSFGPVMLFFDYGFAKDYEACCIKCPDGSKGYSFKGTATLGAQITAEMASYSFYTSVSKDFGAFKASLSTRIWGGVRVYGQLSLNAGIEIEYDTCLGSTISAKGITTLEGSLGFELGGEAYVQGTVRFRKWYGSFLKKTVKIGVGIAVGGRLTLGWNPTISCGIMNCTLSGPASAYIAGTARALILSQDIGFTVENKIWDGHISLIMSPFLPLPIPVIG